MMSTSSLFPSSKDGSTQMFRGPISCIQDDTSASPDAELAAEEMSDQYSATMQAAMGNTCEIPYEHCSADMSFMALPCDNVVPQMQQASFTLPMVKNVSVLLVMMLAACNRPP